MYTWNEFTPVTEQWKIQKEDHPSVYSYRYSNRYYTGLSLRCQRSQKVICFTFLLDERIHLLFDAVVPVGDIHVERVVTAHLLVSPLPPLVKGLHQTGTRLWDHMVHCRRQNGMSGGWRVFSVMSGFLCWLLCLLRVLFVLRNQLSVSCSASPAETDPSAFILITFVRASVFRGHPFSKYLRCFV